jgi:trans-aconitate methyltransferase
VPDEPSVAEAVTAGAAREGPERPRRAAPRAGHIDARLRDTIAVDLPYEGWVADAYELFMPYDAEYADDRVFRRILEAADGTALELACGTGRLLVRYRAAGIDVEGVDVSPDMLAICRGNAAAAGVDVVLHQAGIAPLSLGRTYDTLYCPAGSFMLFHDREVALDALRSYNPHLEAGGTLAIAMGVPWTDMNANYEWRVRRTATNPADGVTVMVHEAVHTDRSAQLLDSYLRYEWWDADGRIVDQRIRRHRLRWWYRDEITRTLDEIGYVDVRVDGDDDGYVVLARSA